jgi:predicted ABC-type ATPase
MPPRMIVVAGPPGGGKSSIFPLARLGTRYFNADDRAAELNGGSHLGIPKQIRETVNREFEAFVSDCISQRESLAIETTLRSPVTFDQAQNARTAGFVIEMRYLALKNFAMHLERIKQRADAGGHSASERTLRRIYDLSLANLSRAFAEIDELWVYDNSEFAGPPTLLLESVKGEVRFLAADSPTWLTTALSLS